jgi:hypothetical protein
MPTRKRSPRPFASLPGHEHLQPLLDAFEHDHPDVDNNVFIAMRFRSGPQFEEIHQAIKTGLAVYGLKGLRADDKTYPPDGDLWANISVYLIGCKFGVCVFEEIDEREFNPNVPLEYGFMRAINRQVLLLKDKRMPRLPTDMTGKIYRTFDSYQITSTIHEQIRSWAERDLDLKPITRKPEMLDLIERLTANTVLILGRFTPERKAVLEAIRLRLAECGYNGVLFHFQKPSTRDTTETISTLAHLSRFIIADITDASSIVQELMAIVPQLPSVPVQPIIMGSQGEFGMFRHFNPFPWVLPVFAYSDENDLLRSLRDGVISPAEAKVKEIQGVSSIS